MKIEIKLKVEDLKTTSIRIRYLKLKPAGGSKSDSWDVTEFVSCVKTHRSKCE